jgi:transposase
MRIIGCDLHARQQTLAMLDTETGEVVNRTPMHEGNEVREFYSELPRPVLVGIEAIGPMQWFLDLLEELGIECQVGDATKIRAAEPRKQKHDRRDAELILKLLVEKRFPAIWMPSKELLDLRALLLHGHQWVRLRTQIQNALQAIALANGLRRGPSLWSYDGQAKMAFLPLPPRLRNDRRDAWWATPKRCSDIGPSVRVNTRTPTIDAPRIQRTGVPRAGQHPKKKTLATADLVRDTALIGT